MLNDCHCGEPLFDNVRVCEKCGAANPYFKAPRWRVLWPETDTLTGAADAIQIGYWTAFVVAVITAVAGVFSVRGSIEGVVGSAVILATAGVFALIGGGIFMKWRAAALLGLLLYGANMAFSIATEGGSGFSRYSSSWVS